MSTRLATATPAIRYSIAGDEHLFAEVSEAMSLEAFFRAMAITRAVEQLALPGVLDVCLANASFQIRFNPDLIHPLELLEQVKALEASTTAERRIQTRIIEIPVLYDDPWTNETQARFRDRHQDPSSTDLQYAARINGHADVAAFIAAHSGSPWFVSMVGFVAGLPFMFQMVEQHQQLQVPKYLRPRTDTPKLTLGHGGCFGCIYSVRGAGGYQMFGVTPAPIYDPQQALPYLQESMVFFRAGDIVQFKPITRTDYDAAIAAVEAGRFDLRIRPASFDLDAFQANPKACIQALKEALHDD
ncbi:5-oxoprolinase subunit B family protein [Herbaspirillum rubrisubalbicans]|jgi:allophanate hydrolase subunit 1|uniref:5-oxoprolinase subunit B family protein n=1 Tax=Herbaspirillum rubrisubalbicans TaxID=80842 RepID=UPI0015584997|nr:allophanate hydrolase subunit 1 [Herbaspirillum rubrisubalbicans]NQE51009.1 allophanate hydrolase [Herbaspirillum rubrisubalbicans]